MPATLTMIGLYNFRSDLFDLMTLPDGIDRNTCIDSILLRCGQFEVLYPDADFMKDAIRLWSSKWYRTFERWQKALSIDYEPLNNYDRTEEWTDDNEGRSTTNGTTKDKTNANVKNRISAYNSSTMQPDTESESSGTSESTLDNVNTSENRNVRKGRAYGNIGVTTSQQMLEAELDVAKWNLYDHIADVFCENFVIPIY